MGKIYLGENEISGIPDNVIKNDSVNTIKQNSGVAVPWAIQNSNDLHGASVSIVNGEASLQSAQHGFYVDNMGNVNILGTTGITIKTDENPLADLRVQIGDTTPTAGQVLAAKDQYGNLQWVNQSGGGGSSLSFIPDVWYFEMPQENVTSNPYTGANSTYFHYIGDLMQECTFRKSYAIFESVSEHYCKLKVYGEFVCEEEKNAFVTYSPNILAMVNANLSKIQQKYPGKSINFTSNSLLIYYGFYEGSSSSSPRLFAGYDTDMLSINDLNGIDENASVGRQLPNLIISTKSGIYTIIGYWEYLIPIE